MRLVGIFLLLALLVIVPFIIWGNDLESGLDGTAWLERWGPWAWVAGVLLLMGDLFLPIPGTAVMSGLGLIYGPAVGGAIASAGSVLGGLLGYGLCRLLGEGVARRLLGEEDLRRGEQLFAAGGGGLLVVLSRWMPVIPEVVACGAGLVRMPFRRFLIALCCGSIPLGFAFATFGAMGRGNAVAAIALSCLIPPALWLTIGRWYLRRQDAAPRESEGRDCPEESGR